MPCVLGPSPGTEDGNIMQAQTTHLHCMVEFASFTLTQQHLEQNMEPTS